MKPAGIFFSCTVTSVFFSPPYILLYSPRGRIDSAIRRLWQHCRQSATKLVALSRHADTDDVTQMERLRCHQATEVGNTISTDSITRTRQQ
jgi:hypothetical protein